MACHYQNSTDHLETPNQAITTAMKNAQGINATPYHLHHTLHGNQYRFQQMDWCRSYPYLPATPDCVRSRMTKSLLRAPIRHNGNHYIYMDAHMELCLKARIEKPAARLLLE
jgi:hypothetical protein